MREGRKKKTCLNAFQPRSEGVEVYFLQLLSVITLRAASRGTNSLVLLEFLTCPTGMRESPQVKGD